MELLGSGTHDFEINFSFPPNLLFRSSQCFPGKIQDIDKFELLAHIGDGGVLRCRAGVCTCWQCEWVGRERSPSYELAIHPGYVTKHCLETTPARSRPDNKFVLVTSYNISSQH